MIKNYISRRLGTQSCSFSCYLQWQRFCTVKRNVFTHGRHFFPIRFLRLPHIGEGEPGGGGVGDIEPQIHVGDDDELDLEDEDDIDGESVRGGGDGGADSSGIIPITLCRSFWV